MALTVAEHGVFFALLERSYIICAPDENSQNVWEEAFAHAIEDHMVSLPTRSSLDQLQSQPATIALSCCHHPVPSYRTFIARFFFAMSNAELQRFTRVGAPLVGRIQVCCCYFRVCGWRMHRYVYSVVQLAGLIRLSGTTVLTKSCWPFEFRLRVDERDCPWFCQAR